MHVSSTAIAEHGQAYVPRVFAEAFRREPLFAGAALFLVVLALPTLVAMALDERMLRGVNVWSKPLKFEAALIVYLATLAWFAGWLPRGTTDTRWYRAFSIIVVACVAAEMVWIGGAAAFGTASHFNVEVPFMTRIYALMGAVAVTLTTATLLYGVLIWRDSNSRLDPAFRLSVVSGLIMTFVGTVIVAGTMSSGTGHLVGGSGTDAGGFPVMGWARDGGDLRVAHFFATHAMHFVPAWGFAVCHMLRPGSARAAVMAFGLLYAGVIGYAFVQALMGQPFFPMLG